MIREGAPLVAGANPILYVIVAIFGGVGVEVTRAVFGRSKMSADTAKTITDAAVTLVRPLEEKAEQLAKQLEETNRCTRLEQALTRERETRLETTERAEKRISRLETKVETLSRENAELRRRLTPPAR
jgi:tRNA(Phe) wybutosine-synthesizing methylase Tyw3